MGALECRAPSATAAAAAAGGHCPAGPTMPKRASASRISRGARIAGPRVSTPTSRSTRSTIFCQRSLSAGKRRTRIGWPSSMPALALAMLSASCSPPSSSTSPARLASMPVKTRPRAAASSLAGVELARLADLAGEIGVDHVEHAVDRLRAAPRSARWKVEYMPALGPVARRSTCTPSVSSSSDATGQMPNTPIEPVMVAGLGHDHVGAHRREVAAGGRDVAHRDDDRLAGAAGARHGVGHGVGRGIGAAGQIDAQHDRLDLLGARRGDRARRPRPRPWPANRRRTGRRRPSPR